MASSPCNLDATHVTSCTLNRLRQTTRTVARRYDAALQAVELKSTQFSLLATLQQCREITLSRLADVLVMDRTTLTRNLKALTQRGYIIMQPSSKDRRVKILCLSPDGQAILAEAEPYWRATQLQLIEEFGEKRWAKLSHDLLEVMHLSQ